MNLSLFLLTLRARLGLFALVLFSTVLAAAIVSLVLPKSYRATVSLLADAKEEQSLNNGLRPLLLPQEMVSYMQTQMDIINSEKVARKVIEDLGLTRDAMLVQKFNESGAAGKGTLEDFLVESLHQGLEVETSQSSVIQLSFTSGDQVLAAKVANAYAKAYIGTTLELRVEPAREAAAWFDVQLKSLRINLEEAQARLTEYHRRQGIVSADERDDVEITRLGALSQQLSASQEQTALWNAREQQARDALASNGSAEKIPDVFNHPLILTLKEGLLRGEAKLQQLSTQYGVNHPQYQSQASENAALHQKLDAEMAKLVAGIGATARQTRQREDETRKSMVAQRSRVLDLKEDRNELTVLKRNVESAEHAYDAANQRFVVSQVDSRASQTNITVLNAASPPRRHFRPKISYNVALAAVVGTMLGIGLVLFAEMLDRRVRSAGDLGLGVPLLAVVNAWQPAGNKLLGRPGRARALPRPG